MADSAAIWRFALAMIILAVFGWLVAIGKKERTTRHQWENAVFKVLVPVYRVSIMAISVILKSVIMLGGGILFLSAIGFFGYGGWRGIVMFFTLEPVAILAGFVLFLVSIGVGFLVCVYIFGGGLLLYSKLDTWSYWAVRGGFTPENVEIDYKRALEQRDRALKQAAKASEQIR